MAALDLPPNGAPCASRAKLNAMRLQPARHSRLADAVLHRQRFQASAGPIRPAHIQQLLPRELDWAVHFFTL